jgi:hypothetical protein
MAIDRLHHSPWTRKHDDPRRPLLRDVPEIVFPRTLADLAEICRGPEPRRLKAAGSHWALSRAAISDATFIETHDPKNARPGLSKTLHTAVPHGLHQDLLAEMRHPQFADNFGTLVHVEAGKRIYQIYAELDQIDPLTNPATLAGFMKAKFGVGHFAGPWGFGTLGGAGGQTVIGALTTGTHGGDFRLPPIADYVYAFHLVADGGRQYWIERSDPDLGQVFDDDWLRDEYGHPAPDPRDFNIIRERDNELFNAALVSVGRFGVIYSVVLRAVRQYSLWERRRLHLWQDVKTQIAARDDGPLYNDPAPEISVTDPNRFLQVVVCLTPHLNFQRNLVGVTKRWTIPVEMAPEGQAERVGRRLTGPAEIAEPVFELAGNSLPYTADPDHPYRSHDPAFLDRACSNGSFIKGVLEEAHRRISEFVDSHGAVLGGGAAAVAAAGGAGLLALLGALALVLLVIKALIDEFADDDRLGEHMEKIKNRLLDPDEPDPATRAAGLFAWQVIAYLVFNELQGDQQFGARSYAVMDTHSYLDKSCNVNVASTEVFFDAVDDRLTTFIDALIAFEISQELRGKAFLGYASLRFTSRTQATLGMQRHFTTCAVEIAGLADVSGSADLVTYANRLALNPNFGGILHWGQDNTATRADIERLFGDLSSADNGSLGAWRRALRQVTEDGRHDGFSSDFTRRTGLEIS